MPVLEVTAGHFFIALVGGLILALAFHLLLTQVSIAAGLNVFGLSLEKKEKKSWSRRKITKAFGVWTLSAACLALFFASWIAAHLTLSASTAMGAMLGLVIWGLFYLVMTTVESSAATSLVGSLSRLALSGMRNAYETTTAMLKMSPDVQTTATAKQITDAIRQELVGSLNAGDIRQEIERYINQLKPKPFSAADFRRELMNVLNDTELRAVTTMEGPLLDQQEILRFAQKKGGGEITKEKAQTVAQGVQDSINTIKQEAGIRKDTGSPAADTSRQMTGMSEEEARQTREKFENYLRSTGKRELNPEGIQHDIQQIVSDPRGGLEALKNRLSQIDKYTTVALLSQRKDINQDEARNIVDQVDQVVSQLKGQTQASGVAGSLTGVRDKVMGRIRDYLDSLDRSELNYEELRHDIQELFSDPQQDWEELNRRFQSMNRDAIQAVLESRKDISDEDAERILERIESVRDEVLQQTDQLKQEIQKRVEMAEQASRHQAEEISRDATTAAWWTFATAAASGVAAVLGGLIGA